MNNKIADRKASFKKGVDIDAGRRRRDETLVQLRRVKKDEQLSKRRAAPASANLSGALVTANEGQPKTIVTASDLPMLMLTLRNTTIQDLSLLNAVRSVRRMLSVEDKPPVDAVIQAGALPCLVKILSRHDSTDLQFEAAWALTNVASTNFTEAVVEALAVPPLVALLLSANADVREQAAWCIGNIAGDSPHFRDLVLNAGALAPLIMNIQNPENASLLGNVVWTVSNLCRGKPQPLLPLVMQSIPALASMIARKGQFADEIVADATWALSYLNDGADDRIQAVFDSGIIPALVAQLGSDSSTVLTPTVRCLGNFVTGTESQTQAVIDAGVLNHMSTLLQHPRKAIRKESCWLLSNIAAGTHKQISALFEKPTVLRMLVNAANNAEWDVRKEAIWAVSNILTGGTDAHVQALVEFDGIETMCDVLCVTDTRLVMVALEAIVCVLKVGLKYGRSYTTLVDECDGLTKIENLQHHGSTKVYELASKIIEDFYGEDEDIDENIAPSTDGNTFSFGIGSASKNLFGCSPGKEQQPSFSFQPQQFSFGGTSSNNGFNGFQNGA